MLFIVFIANLLVVFVNSQYPQDIPNCPVVHPIGNSCLVELANCVDFPTITFQSGVNYIIESAEDQTVVDLFNSVKLQRTPVIAFPRHGGLNQRWTARSSKAPKTFNLVSNVMKFSPYQSLTYDLKQNNTILRTLSDTALQQWYIGRQCREYIQIRVNYGVTNCLTKQITEKPLGVTKCDDSQINLNQLWKIQISK